ncbi:MAG: hypothetical protein RLZZ401_1042 [Pseudomonadota bacterium]|jgi:peptidyl-prolyl cis-trans isomerase SurA
MRTSSVFQRSALAMVIAGSLATGTGNLVLAQGLRPSTQLNPSLAGRRVESVVVAPQGPQQADFIVALVNSEPITNSEVRRRLTIAAQQLSQQGQALPDRAQLTRQVLERMINDRAQMQVARESGVKVDDAALDQAEQNMARQNQLDVPTLRSRLAAEGVSASRFRDDLRQQITLGRLREREVDARVRVNDQDIDQFLQDESANVDVSRLSLNLAQILVAAPEGASAQQVSALEARARRAAERARAGEDFAALVQEFSDGTERSAGGQIGLRNAERYPPLFIDATKNLETGALTGVLRSGAGFHILKVIEKQQAGLPSMVVTQSRARHILLRPTAQMNEAAARDKLGEFRRAIQSGSADFAALAREHSQDGSAKQGGDLGWTSPGMFVPEFEEAMNALAPGDMAPPLVSRFGVHLIQLMERRDAKLTAAEQRQVARGLVREKKMEEAYLTWAQEVRGRAFVELREPPE